MLSTNKKTVKFIPQEQTDDLQVVNIVNKIYIYLMNDVDIKLNIQKLSK